MSLCFNESLAYFVVLKGFSHICSHLHLPLFNEGWFSVATEESFILRSHQTRDGPQQQLEEEENKTNMC